jgi:two-component system, sensor histidine kinase PdtaS
MLCERTIDEILSENEALRLCLQEAEDTLRTISLGEVDAFVVSGRRGDQVFTLKGAEYPYRALVETMSEGAAILSSDGTILYCNGCLATMLSVPVKDLIGSRFDVFLGPEDSQGLAASLARGAEPRGRTVLTLRHADGSVLTALYSCAALDHSGSLGTAVVLTDISDLRNAKLELEEEKTLFRELLHRVKNSLLQIASLARIEAATSRKREVKAALGEFEGRVSALSNLYAMLHSSGDSGMIRLDVYLAEVARALVAAIQNSRARVSLSFETAPISLDPKRAAPLGLALNELLTNAIKYAFEDGRPGQIRLRLFSAEGRIRLEVSNDGAALPPDFDTARSSGLGLTLVRNLMRQLRGNFSWQGGSTTAFSLDFPEKP